MRRMRWWRLAVMLAGAGTVLQLGGCTLDQATTDSLTSALVQIAIQVVLSALSGGVATT